MDTIILKIYGLDKFRVRDKSLWIPELTKHRTYDDLTQTERRSTYYYLQHFVLHPKHTERYMPSVKMYEALVREKKAIQYTLEITFSAPKLLWGNSIQEVTDSNRDQIIAVLRSALASTGINIATETIMHARVGAIHVCKNVLLPPTVRMQEILDELLRVDINKVVDVTGTQHKSGGRTLNIFAGTIDRSFYDKVSDAMRPKNKRKDKWIIKAEREAIAHYGLEHTEMFRYEYRIKKMPTVEREINGILGRAARTHVIFSDLFTPDLCKTLLLKSWRDLIQRPENQLALLGPANNLLLLPHILTEAKRRSKNAHSLNMGLISYGLTRAIQEHGAKEVRRMVLGMWHRDHSERLTHKIRTAAGLTQTLAYANGVSFVDHALEHYELITPALLEKQSAV